jgi:hypothetical protein
MENLRIELLSERDNLFRLDRDCAELVHGVEHIIFEVAIFHRNLKPGRIHRDLLAPIWKNRAERLQKTLSAAPIDPTVPNVQSGQGLKRASFPSADETTSESWGGSGLSSGLTVFFSSLRCLFSSCFFFFANSFWRFSD